jgi:hypothetical protein
MDGPSSTTAASSTLPKDFFSTTQPDPATAVDEDEWAAFERDVLPLAASPKPETISASATISAPALSASEIAAREARENVQTKVEQDIEGEKEDAARALEEEFDEMEGLEERARKLREKREELRKRALERTGDVEGVSTELNMKAGDDTNESGEEDEEDEDEWDAWRMRGS